MAGNKPMNLEELELAIVLSDIERIDKIMDAPLEFKNLDDMKRALYLMSEALKILYDLKDETNANVRLIKKNINFLNATRELGASSIDLRT